MSMTDELKRVYVGSRVETLFIKEMLKESGIGFMEKDVLQSSMQAGWVDGLPEDRVRIFVNSENFEKAKKLIEGYIAERDEK